MARARRGIKGGCQQAILNGDHNNSITTISTNGVSSWSGINTNGAGTATIDRGKSNEETVTFTGISGSNLTGATRGTNGTSAVAHTSGATVEVTTSVTDADEANELVAAAANNACRVYNSTDIAIATASLGPLTFNSERFDTGALHSTSANTSHLTCVTAAKYYIFGSVEWAANSTGYRQLAIRLNGTTYIANVTTLPVTGAVTQMTVGTVYALSASDYVELMVAQTSGGDLLVKATGNYSPEFGMSFVAF